VTIGVRHFACADETAVARAPSAPSASSMDALRRLEPSKLLGPASFAAEIEGLDLAFHLVRARASPARSGKHASTMR